MQAAKLPFLTSLTLLLALYCCQDKTHESQPVVTDFEVQLQEKIDGAGEGDVIELPEGSYELHNTLMIKNVKNITIKGQGKQKTILIFKDLPGGQAGFTIKADGIVLEDFTLLNPKGDGIKAEQARSVTVRRVKVNWSKPASAQNGSFALHFNKCNSILLDDCEAYRAANAGIYLVGCRDIILKRNHLKHNLAGIELQNSSDADMLDNLVDSNSIGVFLCSLPNAPIKNTGRCRMFGNRILHNNQQNFASKGTILSEIPSGTGVFLLAVSQCEISGNVILNHRTVPVLILSYSVISHKATNDAKYDPHCSGIAIQDTQFNKFEGALDSTGAVGTMLAKAFGNQAPAVVYDGAINQAYRNANGTVKNDRKICLHNNTDATFCNLDLPGKGTGRTNNAQLFDCGLPALTGVQLN